MYLVERDGVRLMAARTLSREAEWRQLSVRRLVTMVKLVLDREMQWAVFEPNGAALRSKVVQLVEVFLRRYPQESTVSLARRRARARSSAVATMVVSHASIAHDSG